MRRRFFVLLLCGVLAAALGFVVISPATAEPLLISWGYYYLAAVVAAFVAFAWRVAAARRSVWRGWWRRPGGMGLVLVGATAFTIWADPFNHKILYDEYVLQGTAWHMHATKTLGTPLRGHEIAGTWQTLDTFLDKRPFFFPFTVSVVHDLTGFRPANAFAVNVALVPIFLGLVYWLARTFSSRGAAQLAVGLIATLPLLGQSASGAGMELHNVCMVALVLALAVLYLRAPDDDRLSALLFGTVLLAQCRYESLLFVAPVAAIVVLGWWRAGRLLLPWPVFIAPFLVVPCVWHYRIVSSKPILWQLREGETSRFGLQYLAGNLEGAWRFFFSTSGAVANSWWLSALGLAGLAWALVHAVRRLRTGGLASLSPGGWAFAAFAACIAVNLGLLMFYYWSRLDEPIASRFALPGLFVAALLAAWLVHDLERRGLRAIRVAAIGLAVWFFGWGAPAYARRIYTSQNLVMLELDWELEQIRARRGPALVITGKASLPFLLEHIPVLNTAVARARAPQIAWHLREGTFAEVYVVQGIRPTTPEGLKGVDPDDLLPENFRLEPIAEKRFGGRWSRISRLTDLEVGPIPPRLPAVGAAEAGKSAGDEQ